MIIPSKNRCLIIAEAGVNHNGDLELAKKLVQAAAEAGADYVKFQTFTAEMLVTQTAKQAAYQKKNLQSGENDSQYEMLKKLELSRDAHYELIKHSNYYGINFLSTAFDNENLRFLCQDLDLDYIKIPSGELTNYPYLRQAASMKKPIILSTGMASLDEVTATVQLLISFGVIRSDLYILHCTTNYPTLVSEVNLNAMRTLADTTGCKVGYSDHTMGIAVPVAAAAMGACIIEKHFTLDRSLPGPDQLASLEPNELRQMVIDIRNVGRALGDGCKKPACIHEINNRSLARKSIVAIRNIVKGEVFSESNLGTKRPGTGLSPMTWPKVIGRISNRDYAANDLIDSSVLEETR